MSVEDNVEYGMRVKQDRQGGAGKRGTTRSRWCASPATRTASPASSPAASASASPSPAPSSTAPRVLLLDEPLGALDLKLREQMQVELKGIQGEVGITFIYVTHDQDEALTMSDRVAVFNEGRIEQIGGPAEIYEHPGSRFVGGFVGVSNVLERDGRSVHDPPGEAPPPRARRRVQRRPRTEHGRVDDVAYAGMVTRYLVALDRGGELLVVRQNLETTSEEALAEKGREVTVGWRAEHAVAVPDEKRKGSSHEE